MTINSQEWSLIFSIVKRLAYYLLMEEEEKARKDVSRI